MTTKFDIDQEVFYFGGLLEVCRGKILAISIDKYEHTSNPIRVCYRIEHAASSVTYEDSIAVNESGLWQGLADRYNELASLARVKENEPT